MTTTTADKGPTKRVIAAGAAGALVLGLAAALIPAGAAEADVRAVMLAPAQQTVVDAVAAAEVEAARVAAAAAAEAERAAATQSQIDAVVNLAHAQVGDAYRLGASGPDVFDCSGFTMWVYANAAGVSLPHNTHAQWNAVGDTWYAGEREPRPGDLVFFFSNGADHVGLYVGDGMMVHAANPRTGVEVASVYDSYWGNKLTGFGRVIH